ncbi:MAG: hypothetical protein WC141_09145 [Arcobacteraceae bacterium]
MKLCKICNKEITNPKSWVYCSDECVTKGRKLANDSLNHIRREKYNKAKENWNYEVLELGKVKHNKKIPINKLGLTNSVSTYLKLLLREYNLTSKKDIKIKRSDGVTKSYFLVVVTPKMIETLFYKRYEIYKNNFRVDCLRNAKTLEKVFNIVNEYK